jgi:Ala-tRNA(Pro) deacylase
LNLSFEIGEIMRIYNFLKSMGIAFDIIQHPPAFSAQKLAKYLHTPGRQIAKTVLLKTMESYKIAILPADKMLDKSNVEFLIQTRAKMANPMNISELFFDCEWGLVPAFGSAYGISTILDSSLLECSSIVVPGHSHLESIRISSKDFINLESPILGMLIKLEMLAI